MATGDNGHTQGVRFAGLGFDEQEALKTANGVPWFGPNTDWPPKSGIYNLKGGTKPVKVEIVRCEKAPLDPSPDPFFAVCDGVVYNGSAVQDTTACDPKPVRSSGRRAGASPGPKTVPLLAIRGKWNTATKAFDQDNSAITFACAPTFDGKSRPAVSLAAPLTGDIDDPPNNLDESGGLGVLSKCYYWGFAQPKEIDQNRFINYQACLRAARADYCGDGISQTEQGTIIQVYEPNETKVSLPIKVPLKPQYCASLKDPKSSQRTSERKLLKFQPCFEALWDSQGALCVSHTRFKEMPVKDCSKKFPNEFLVNEQDARLLPPGAPDGQAYVNCLATDYKTAVNKARVKNRSGINHLDQITRLSGPPVQSCVNDIPCP